MNKTYSFVAAFTLLTGGLILFLVSLIHHYEHIDRHHYHPNSVRRVNLVTT